MTKGTHNYLEDNRNKDISPQSVFAHSDKDPRILDSNKIDRFYKCFGYKLDITN